MEGRILILEANRLVCHAVRGSMVSLGYSVTSVGSAAEATQLPQQFDCGIFADTLPDANPIGLAGWLLVEQRIQCAVFFGTARDVELRLRASNLGTYVCHEEGLGRLERAVRNALSEVLPSASSIRTAAAFELRTTGTQESRHRRIH